MHTLQLSRGQSRFFGSKFTAVPLTLSRVILCASLPLNLIILTVFVEFLRMSRLKVPLLVFDRLVGLGMPCERFDDKIRV